MFALFDQLCKRLFIEFCFTFVQYIFTNKNNKHFSAQFYYVIFELSGSNHMLFVQFLFYSISYEQNLNGIWMEIEQKFNRNWTDIKQELNRDWAEIERELNQNWPQMEQKFNRNWGQAINAQFKVSCLLRIWLYTSRSP